jgi:hypothetical protein
MIAHTRFGFAGEIARPIFPGTPDGRHFAVPVSFVPVLPQVAEAVGEYLKTLPFGLAPDEPLFRAKRGGPLGPRPVQLLMARLRGRLGLPETAGLTAIGINP